MAAIAESFASPSSMVGSAGPREALVARWLVLTREVLPAMAAGAGWPVHLDHCFMRICLDTALGAPWHSVVARPAVRTLSDAQLAAAVAIAERIVACPESLPALNRASLQGRRRLRSAARSSYMPA